jgi:uncharacterized protein (DUF302 family)
MLYIRKTKKSVDEAMKDLEASVERHGFGVLHTYDFKATLADKGFELANECRVVEICNPKQANEILHEDMTVNMALPCRVSIYEDGGDTRIGMIPPTSLLGLISQSADLSTVAKDVEKTVAAIIDESI